MSDRNKKEDEDYAGSLHAVEPYPPAKWGPDAPTPDLDTYRRRWIRSIEEPESFWAEQARELVWEEEYKIVLDWNPPHARWFDGGKINASVQCLDRHVGTLSEGKTAFLWEGEPETESHALTYREVLEDVCRLANGLRKLGVGKGDRIAIYMPMTPELPVACLACARIGAIHTVVFGGFSSDSLRDRIDDCGAKLVITADGGWRRGKKLDLKTIVDEAVTSTDTIEHVLVVRRSGDEFPHKLTAGRDLYWDDVVEGMPADCPPEPMDSEDTLFILYTSGTTGKPKGIYHTHAGYLLGTRLTSREVFDLRDDDVYWCTADIGWITGHSYVVYGPMQLGVTQVIYEGAPNWPDPDRVWKIVAKYGVTVFYTAPTAIRSFMKCGDEWPERNDLSSLRVLGTVGEPINPEAWEWYRHKIGGDNCPIVDTWWQTETGAISITPLPGATPTKPGSATLPFYGIDAVVLDESGNEVEEGNGLLAIRKPWPSMLRGIWGDEQRFVDTYWSKWDKPFYFPGDGASRDADGYFWIAGRVDDVVNISGHRIGTAELESAFDEHEAVVEAAVVGVKHEIKGEGLVGFASLAGGWNPSPELAAELREWIGKKIGAFAKPERVIFVADLPKTRSGKIMRRLLRDIAEGRVLGDVTTLADAEVVKQIQGSYAGKKGYEE